MRRRAAARRLVAALPVVALLAWPGMAAGHAVLVHSTPHRGQSVPFTPPVVVFDFNEPVEVSFGAVRVFNEDGERVDRGGIVRPNDSSSSVGVRLRDGLGDGIYTGTFRVISADGHPVSGGLSFGVGRALPTGGRAPSVAELLDKSSAGPAVEGTYGVVRALHYAALLFALGALIVGCLVWPAAGLPVRWPRRGLIAAAVLGLLGSLAAIALQGALGAGVSLGHALDRTILDGSLDTRTGTAWAIRAAAWVVALLVLVVGRTPRRLVAALAGAALAVVLVSLPLAGHADTHSPKLVLIPADLFHVLAAGVWLGGLVTLIVVYWPRRSQTSDPQAVTATAAFSRLALPAMIVLAAAGALQGWFYLGSPGELLSGTYSLALLAKIALVSAIIALAVVSRRGVRAMTRARSAANLRATMRAEVALAVLVLAATAVLVRAAPPATLAAGPAQRELNLGPMRLELVIEPAKTGPNDFHLYLFNRRTGAQIDRVRQLTVRLIQRDKNIGPIKLNIPRKGPAHYELLDEALGVPGPWNVEVTARVSDFDVYRAETEIEVK